MSFKLALLLLFGFVALAVAVPIENTEEKAEPAEAVEADPEIPEAPQEEFQSDESEDENQEDSEEEPEADDKEEEPENDVEAKEDDDNEEPKNEGDEKEEDDNEKRGRPYRMVRRCGRPMRRPHKCPRLGFLCVVKGYKKYYHQICYTCKKGKRRPRRRYLTVKVCQSCRRCNPRYYRTRLLCGRLCVSLKGRKPRRKCDYVCKCRCVRRPACRKVKG